MNLPHSPIAARPAHAGASQAAVAHRAEEQHSAGQRNEAARKSDMLQHPAHESAAGRDPHPGQSTAEARRPAQGAATPRINRDPQQVVPPPANPRAQPHRPNATASAAVRAKKKSPGRSGFQPDVLPRKSGFQPDVLPYVWSQPGHQPARAHFFP